MEDQMAKQEEKMTRRRFVYATAATATAGGALVSGTHGLSASSAGTRSEYPSTDHFWYRLAPAGPHIDSQCDNKAFGFGEGRVFLSEDNSRTWPHSLALPDARNLTFSHIFRNGNILFATTTALYLSTDNLRTCRQITVKDSRNADLIPHRPKNPEYPGWYFSPLTGVNSWTVHGAEMLVWGNYCNVLGGASPVNIYYSADNGQTVKIAYAFGQNPHFRDDGSPGGGTSGTLLGNPDNPLLSRHVHCVAYNPAEDAFYASTGDIDRGVGLECHWLRGTYDAKKDEWRWRVLVSVDSNSRYKSGGINFVDGRLYWVSDANAFRPWDQGTYDRGIFRCAPADLANPKAHTLLFNPKVEAANMVIQDGVILSAHYTGASPLDTGIIISPDMGRTWAQYDLKELGKRSPLRFSRKNSEGWFRVDLRKGAIERAEVLFIKPKK
jgi:hypothetical protein